MNNYFKAGVRLRWEQVNGLLPNQLATDIVYPDADNKIIVSVPQPANFRYAKVIGSYGESSTGIPVEPLYRVYPEFPVDDGDYILKLNHLNATVGGGEKLTWETYTPSSGSATISAATVNGQPIVSNTEGETGDIQVACYMELNYNFDDLVNNDATAKAALKPQIDKWLQTSILNNTTIRPTNPRPCILKLNDCQLMLAEYTSGASDTVTSCTYVFMSPVITNETLLTRKVNKLTIGITVQSTADEIGFDEYAISTLRKVVADIRNVTATTIQPPSATSGTLNENQLQVLKNARQNLLRLDKEFYHKNAERGSNE